MMSSCVYVYVRLTSPCRLVERFAAHHICIRNTYKINNYLLLNSYFILNGTCSSFAINCGRITIQSTINRWWCFGILKWQNRAKVRQCLYLTRRCIICVHKGLFCPVPIMGTAEVRGLEAFHKSWVLGSKQASQREIDVENE